MTKKLCLLAILFAAGAVYADTVEVRIEKMKFAPQEVRVKAGDTVVWKSYEKRGYHTVWFKAEGFPESGSIFPDESWERVFQQQGEFPYICGPHPEMTGKVIVE